MLDERSPIIDHMCISNSNIVYQYISIIYKFYFIHIYLIIVTIVAYYEQKDKKVFIKNCLHHLISQMPPSPRITNASVTKDHKL